MMLRPPSVPACAAFLGVVLLGAALRRRAGANIRLHVGPWTFFLGLVTGTSLCLLGARLARLGDPPTLLWIGAAISLASPLVMRWARRFQAVEDRDAPRVSLPARNARS